MYKKILCFSLLIVGISNSAVASKYWTSIGDGWELSFDNGQTYINSTALPDGNESDRHNCLHDRAQMSKTYGDEDYRHNIYAYLLTGLVTNKNLKIVLDDEQSTCEFFGARFY